MRASSLTPSHMRCSPAARLHPVSLRRPPRLASLVSTACNDGAAASLRPEGPPAFLSRQGGRRKKTTHSLDGTGTRDESHRATLSATHSVALSYCDARGKRGECVRASAHASEFGPSGSGGGRQGSAGRRDGGFLGRLRDPEVVYRPTEEWLSRVVESASRRGSKAMWKWWSMLQLAASAAYVVLYVYSTYVKLAPGGIQHMIELGLCTLFAIDFLVRLSSSVNPARKFFRLSTIVELMTFLPPLLDWFIPTFLPHLQVPWPKDLKMAWIKIFRLVTIARRIMLAGQLQAVHLTSPQGIFSSEALPARIFSLISSVVALLLTSACVIQLVEQIPWHDALYFSATTLTTVGLGDVAPKTVVGKLAIIVVVLVGVVAIPVRASQVYAFWSMRRSRHGTLPTIFQPFVLVSVRLTDIRAFNDFFSEFFHEMATSRRQGVAERSSGLRLPSGKTKMLCVTDKPPFEFQAFQEVNFRRLTLIEGSLLNDSDLDLIRARRAAAALLIADRFSPRPAEEDKALVLKVWSLRAYTAEVPLFVQTISKAAAAQIAPFLDRSRDAVLSLEDVRFSLLAFSTVCPGASTLLGNMLRSGSGAAPGALHGDKMAGMRWLRQYVQGSAHRLRLIDCPKSFAGVPFVEAAECLYRRVGAMLIAVKSAPPLSTVLVNPARMMLSGSESLVVLVTSDKQAQRCTTVEYRPAHAPFVSVPDLYATDDIPQPSAGSINGAVDDGQTTPAEEGAGGEGDGSGGVESGDIVGREGEASSGRSWQAGAADLVPKETGECGGAGEQDCGAERREEKQQNMREDAGETREGTGDPTRPTVLSESSSRSAVGAPEGLASGGPPASSEGLRTRDPDEQVLTQHEEVSDPEEERRVEVESHNRALEGTRLRVVGRSGERLLVHRSRRDEGEGAGDGPGGLEASADASMDFEVDPIVLSAIEDDVRSARAAAEEAGGSEAPEGGHVIVFGDEKALVPYCQMLRHVDCKQHPILVMFSEDLKDDVRTALQALGDVFFMKGVPSDPGSLRQAHVTRALAFVFLAAQGRTASGGQAAGEPQVASEAAWQAQGVSRSANSNAAWRASVLADSEALMTCYTVGEGLANVTAIVELCHTTSLRFVQPGMLLPGVEETYRQLNFAGIFSAISRIISGAPLRAGYRQMRRQEEAAADEGLAGWQVNSFYCAGKVMVPALLDTLTCQAFFNHGLLPELLRELQGGGPDKGGMLLRQIPVPEHLVGSTYLEAVTALTLTRRLVPLGLYRVKEENSRWRLPYVHTNPPGETVLRASDKIFVLRERRGAWLT